MHPMIRFIIHILKPVRIWKIHHLDPRCSIVSILQLVYFTPCTVQFQKISILRPQKALEFPGDGGLGVFSKTQKLKKSMKFNWNFQRASEFLQKIPSMGEVWIISGSTHFGIFSNLY